MDFETLKLVGSRGVIIAITGSILPISIGTGAKFMDRPKSLSKRISLKRFFL